MTITAQDMAERRAIYMSSKDENAHQEYYQWLAESIGIGPSMLPPDHARSKDPHFNDVLLSEWDQRHTSVVHHAQRAFARVGTSAQHTFAWSLSDSVCCLKAIARRERNKRNGVTK
jgi:hypothetical protein